MRFFGSFLKSLINHFSSACLKIFVRSITIISIVNSKRHKESSHSSLKVNITIMEETRGLMERKISLMSSRIEESSTGFSNSKIQIMQTDVGILSRVPLGDQVIGF